MAIVEAEVQYDMDHSPLFLGLGPDLVFKDPCMFSPHCLAWSASLMRACVLYQRIVCP